MSKYDEVLMETTKLWAEQSYCEKNKVGGVLAIDGRIIATGYNGTVSGTPNICEIEDTCSYCNGQGRVRIEKKYNKSLDWDNYECDKCYGRGYRLQTSPFTVHAEQNVLMFCARNGIATEGATMYITLSPCSNCAKLMVQAGIKRVVYLNNYKDISGIDFLQTCGVEVQHGTL